MRHAKMNFRTLIIIFVGLTSWLPSFSQTNELDKVDIELTTIFNDFVYGQYENRDSIGLQIKQKIKNLLTNPETFDYPFDSTSKYIKITKSPDNKLRIYSWNEMSGGTWHDIAVFAQFKTDNDKIRLRQLDSDNEDMTGEFTDAGIYEIHTITIDNQIHYLTLGAGTHGSGHHHSIVQIFKIQGENLVKCEDCFEFQKDLVVEVPRAQNIDLQFNSDKLEITHNEFRLVDSTGFSMSTGEISTWKLKDGIFKK